MYVCVCLAVTDREVEAAIDDGACSREAVTKACAAGGDCGACHEMIEKMIGERADLKSGVIHPSRLTAASRSKTGRAA